MVWSGVPLLQYHEVVGFLCGRFMGHLTAFFVIIYVFGISIAQVVACSSDAYYWRTNLDKRSALHPAMLVMFKCVMS